MAADGVSRGNVGGNRSDTCRYGERGLGRGGERSRHGYGGNTDQGAAADVHNSRFPVLDPENSATRRGHTEPQTLCLDGGNSAVLEVSRLMTSPDGAPFTVADQRRSHTGFPSRAVQQLFRPRTVPPGTFGPK